MKNKPKTPYQRLLEDVQEWALKVSVRHTVAMWCYPKEKLTEGWKLDDLWERTKAAEQLGYDVIVTANGDGLTVSYRKQVPDVPWQWK